MFSFFKHKKESVQFYCSHLQSYGLEGTWGYFAANLPRKFFDIFNSFKMAAFTLFEDVKSSKD